MNEPVYWVWVFHGKALFYDLSKKDKPVLSMEYGDDSPRSAQGLNVSMFMQSFGQRFPPDVEFTGTVDDAKRIINREQAVSVVEAFLERLVFESDDFLSKSKLADSKGLLRLSLHEIENLLNQVDVIARVRELKIPEVMLKSLEIDLPGTGVARLRTRLASSPAPLTTALFFTE